MFNSINYESNELQYCLYLKFVFWTKNVDFEWFLSNFFQFYGISDLYSLIFDILNAFSPKNTKFNELLYEANVLLNVSEIFRFLGLKMWILRGFWVIFSKFDEVCDFFALIFGFFNGFSQKIAKFSELRIESIMQFCLFLKCVCFFGLNMWVFSSFWANFFMFMENLTCIYWLLTFEMVSAQK